MTPAHTVRDPVLEALGLTVLQRDWLSANHSVFAAHPDAPATVVDTGYARHSAMTLALLDHALGGEPVQRIVNTHLHADHCGGNAALQQRDPQVQTWIPQASLAAVHAWDMTQLSYVPTGQHCPAFRATGGLSAAVMLFEPQTRTLIAGDALWEDRLAIIFPELEDQPGFGATRQTLGMIEALAPRRVVPGHGGVFEDVAAALAASRRRLDAFEREPLRHVRHAARALLMFHMMEHDHRERSTLLRWLVGTPLFVAMARRLSGASAIEAWAADLVDSLLDDGLLADHGGVLSLAASPSR
jgi:glyoxylase-like metal-dependent hydrolase (beta-lactamase superfamily II)